MRQVGYFRMTYELLGQLLNLPEDHRVIEVWHDFDDYHTKNFRVVVEGPTMPEKPEGTIVKEVRLVYDEKGDFIVEEVKDE